jgi:hypothetical protein
MQVYMISDPTWVQAVTALKGIINNYIKFNNILIPGPLNLHFHLVLRTVFGLRQEEVTRRRRQLHNEEFHNLYFTPTVTEPHLQKDLCMRQSIFKHVTNK